MLVHTTANTTWSSLPLSGVFVEMLQRIAALAPGAGGDAARPAGAARGARCRGPPRRARARPRSRCRPPSSARPWPPARAIRRASTGQIDAGSRGRPPGPQPRLGGARPAGAARGRPAGAPEPYAGSAETDLMPWLLLAALLLALADTAIGLQLRGLLIRPAPRRAGGVALLRAAAAGAAGARADRCGAERRGDRRRDLRDPPRLRPDRARRSRRDEPRGSRGSQPRAQPAHRDRGRRAARGRSRGRRPRPVPAALLADPGRPSAARAGRARAARRLSAPGRHDPVRHRATPRC